MFSRKKKIIKKCTWSRMAQWIVALTSYAYVLFPAFKNLIVGNPLTLLSPNDLLVELV